MKKNIRLKLKIFACVGLVMALIVGGTFGYIVFDKKTKADGNIEDVRMSKINEEQCHFICKKLSEGYNRHEIKEMCDFNVSLDIC